MPSTAAHGRTKKTPSGKPPPKAKAAAGSTKKTLKSTKGAPTPPPAMGKVKSGY